MVWAKPGKQTPLTVFIFDTSRSHLPVTQQGTVSPGISTDPKTPAWAQGGAVLQGVASGTRSQLIPVPQRSCKGYGAAGDASFQMRWRTDVLASCGH